MHFSQYYELSTGGQEQLSSAKAAQTSAAPVYTFGKML
jgi:hypothetical protein